MRLLGEGMFDVNGLCIHHFGLADMQDACEPSCGPPSPAPSTVVPFGDQVT